MISIEQAQQQILDRAQPLPACKVDLTDALHCCLAEDVASDVDSPPFDKALMDGYAVRSQDIDQPGTTLRILEEVTAGSVPLHEVAPGTATRIMTGGPLPSGADAVVMIEKTECLDAEPPAVRIMEYPVRAEQNLMRLGECMRKDSQVLARGTRLTPAQVGLLAEVGRDPVLVFARPTVAILSTGSELVPPGQSLGPGQIRNSNGPMIEALVQQCGAVAHPLGIVGDDPDSLERAIQPGLGADVLVISGGVSAGVLDLVPSILAKNDVREVFHKVQMKPGKPLWFGENVATSKPTLVFGLPGNPVSSFACFQLFVRPALARLAGGDGASAEPSFAEGRLSAARQAANRTTYFPATFDDSMTKAKPTVHLLPWKGSADLRTVALATCLAELPIGEELDVGSTIRFLKLD